MKAVIFDLDGTLIDSMGVWLDVDKDFLGKRGIDVPKDLFDSVPQGNSYSGLAQYFKERFNLPETIEEIMQEWTDRVYELYKTEICLKPGALDVLQFLKENEIPMAIGTSNSDELAALALSKNDISEYFLHVQTGSNDIKGKPHPDIYLNTATKLNISPKDILVVEDTIAGIQAGNNAGMTTIGIYDKWAKHEHEQIKAEANDFIANHFELLEKFQLIFRKNINEV